MLTVSQLDTTPWRGWCFIYVHVHWGNRGISQSCSLGKLGHSLNHWNWGRSCHTLRDDAYDYDAGNMVYVRKIRHGDSC